ncbi:MAG: family 20 glycosylhydrolase [Bacteroidetes bacterium]|nr:family 20 glycosylhydrolase [Bacteroidota bacterium]
MDRNLFYKSLFLWVLMGLSTSLAWAQVHSSWDLVDNKFTSPERHSATLTLTNRGTTVLDAGWKLYFNTIFIAVRSQSLNPKLNLKHLQGDFFVWEGKTPALQPNESFSFSYQSQGAFLKNAYPPEGLILAHMNGKVEEISQVQNEVISEAMLAKMAAGTTFPVTSPQQRYTENRSLYPLPDKEIPPYLPSPKTWKYTGPALELSPSSIQLDSPKELEKIRDYLEKSLQKGYIPKDGALGTPLRIRFELLNSLPKEGYAIQTTGAQVLIQASTSLGALYGANSFLAMLSPVFWKGGATTLTFPQVTIEDAPAFGYRGLFLDVARNFQSKEQVLKLLDLMSFYKLNVFHFNLANDEGWRIEIPGLPELTQFGGRRGFSIDESEFLWPYYASGANINESPSGTGFYTVTDFQEILAYAKERQIEVIPELGVPAHSRAAILAMEKRYQTLKDAGKLQEALAYRLADPEDQSKYLSAQNFKGNTVCVCQESTYEFYEKLVVEIGKMYTEAGAEVKNWHTGGDEVPKGVWTASPICEEFLGKNPSIQREDLIDYFRERTAGILKKHGWKMGGWEEIGQTHASTTVSPNPKFANQDWKLYAWNAVAGWGGEDMAYKLANAGYPVIICSSANFYFDLAYSWDPDERGHSWSGVVDLYQSWKAVPGKLYLSHDQTIDGKPWNWSDAAQRFTKLTEKGRQNIIGVSGQVWTETIKGAEMLEYYLFPKMLGFVERAWNGDPDWSTKDTEDGMKAAKAQEWNQFVNLVGQRELPRLETIFGGVQFRLPKPGVLVKDEQVMVNAAFPGMLIRYTDSGQEPTENSPIYREPIFVRPGYTPRFKLFMQSGKSGMSSGKD